VLCQRKDEGQKPYEERSVDWNWTELFEIWAEDFDPDTFFQQTHRTLTAALRGRRARDTLEAKRDLAAAWNTAAFTGAASVGKLKPLSQYLSDPEQDRRTKSAQAIAFFHRMKASGAPVEISRTVN